MSPHPILVVGGSGEVGQLRQVGGGDDTAALGSIDQQDSGCAKSGDGSNPIKRHICQSRIGAEGKPRMRLKRLQCLATFQVLICRRHDHFLPWSSGAAGCDCPV